MARIETYDLSPAEAIALTIRAGRPVWEKGEGDGGWRLVISWLSKQDYNLESRDTVESWQI